MSGGNEIENENNQGESKCVHIHYHYHYHRHEAQPQSPPSVHSSSPSPHTVKIFCRANDLYNLEVRNGAVVLGPAHRNNVFQHWTRYNSTMKDENGSLAFALVNEVTGLAIQHALNHDHPARLVPYVSDNLDVSVLWTETSDKGHGFRGIRTVNNTGLFFDAMRGDKFHEGVHDGTGLLLFKWWAGDNHNQQWKIVPWCKRLMIILTNAECG